MRNFFIVLTLAMVAGCGGGEVKPADTQKVSTLGTMHTAAASSATSAMSQNDMILNGVDSLHQGDVLQAIKSFDKAIRENPGDVNGYMILGQTYMHLKEYNRAIDTLMAATEVAPENGQVHYLLATNFGLAGNFSQARLQAQKSAEIFRRNQDEGNFKRSVALLQGLPPVAGK